MALAKDPKDSDPQMSLLDQASTYFSAQVSEESSPDQIYVNKAVPDGGDPSDKAAGAVYVKKFAVAVSRSSSLSSPSSTNSSGGYVYGGAANCQPEEAHSSVINFKTRCNNSTSMRGSGSFLSFEQNDHQNNDYYSIWEDNLFHGISSSRLLPDFNCVQSCTRETQHGPAGDSFGWPNFEADTAAISTIQEFGTQELASFNKRPHSGESGQAGSGKRQCSATGETKKAKPKLTTVSKDPQSVAAKNRRERISERLKILQELVPNGSKVDLVTMLEKAISYVKFLQLQVKVLATDEFWPVQGGKAPDISQVKEALDAILSSQKDTISSSK